MEPSHIVVGLGFGDEGKGSIVDALVRRTGASTVVRFNGGAQAAHNVVTDDGRHHTFSQWGSGTLAGARTILTKDVVISPLAMVEEAKVLMNVGVTDPFSLLTVDERALVCTPYHAMMNQVRETVRGSDNHGTCGVGVGEAVADSLVGDDCIRVTDLLRPDDLASKVKALRASKVAEALKLMKGETSFDAWSFLNDVNIERGMIERLLDAETWINIAAWDEVAEQLRRGNLVFEGAQGVLLDEWHGFHPHTTWSTTTGDNARSMFASAGVPGELKTVGVIRAYATRHGAGPFPTELDVPARDGEHNDSKGRQGRFRVGRFDAMLTRYALEADGLVDALAVTCVDHLGDRTCVAYDSEYGRITKLRVDRSRDLAAHERLGSFLRTVTPVFERRWTPQTMSSELDVPLMVESHGPRTNQKQWI
jgi:adenylosuccinate synthase